MDYKELIERLRRVNCVYANDYVLNAATCKEAADAIETLLTELDTVVDSMHGDCRKCKYMYMNRKEQPCSNCYYANGIIDYWKWYNAK